MSLLYRRNYHVVCVTYTAMQLVAENCVLRLYGKWRDGNKALPILIMRIENNNFDYRACMTTRVWIFMRRNIFYGNHSMVFVQQQQQHSDNNTAPQQHRHTRWTPNILLRAENLLLFLIQLVRNIVRCHSPHPLCHWGGRFWILFTLYPWHMKCMHYVVCHKCRSNA